MNDLTKHREAVERMKQKIEDAVRVFKDETDITFDVNINMRYDTVREIRYIGEIREKELILPNKPIRMWVVEDDTISGLLHFKHFFDEFKPIDVGEVVL